MRIVCWHMILMNSHTFFFSKLGTMSQNLLSAAVVIGPSRRKAKKMKVAFHQFLWLFYKSNSPSVKIWYLSNIIIPIDTKNGH